MDQPIPATASITAVLGPRTFLIRLPNGKPATGFLPEHSALPASPPQPGDLVAVELTPFDFDHARIVALPASA